MKFFKQKAAPFFALYILFVPLRADGQTIYFNNINWQYFSFDIATCTETFIVTGLAVNDMAIAPSGFLYGLLGQTIWVTNPGSGISTAVGDYPNILSPSLEWGLNGQLYLIDIVTRGLFTVNPLTGVSQLVGIFPVGWTSIGDLVFLNGNCYGTFNTPSGAQLVNINVTNPAASTLLGALPAGNLVGGASVSNATCPKLYWFDTPALNQSSTLWEYDVNNQTWTQICPGFIYTVGGADSQNNNSFPISCGGCTTNAGNVTAQNFTFCGTTATVNVPFTGGQTLDPNDLLRYIIFTNLSDPEGSILVQSATPNFSFNPATMTAGQTYYLGTVAGNGLNGVVSLDDPCLDFSNNFAAVLWRALPTVELSVDDPEVCAGQCQTVWSNFTGNPPFNLTYTSPVGGQQTQIFAGVSGSFQICLPANFSAGGVLVSAVSLADANCVCN